MIPNVLRAIGGIGVYDTISICLFVLVFCGVLVWALRLKRCVLDEMSSLPLRDEQDLTKQDNRHD
jgi:cytochrome c oxidase cbb3-type subunit 4